ncbi:hypothetical protein KY339_04275 [Candidatus Woesearchaeota archaeon]|nr:hypothetical protein [Candidatus Woesearchaeota archaeon]
MTILNEILLGFWQIIKSPFQDLSVLWLLVPIVVLWFTFEIYFGKHREEKLGWNTALGNGVSFCWVAVSVMKFIFTDMEQNFTWAKFFIILGLLCYGLFIVYISFTHTFSERVTYIFASPTAVYFLSGVGVLWGYGALEISLWVFIDLVIFFLLAMLLAWILKRYIFKPKHSKT